MSDACKNCNGACCYDIVVRITGFDAARIARTRALDISAIADTAIDTSGNLAAFRIGTERRSLYLAKNAHAPDACTFLMHLPEDSRRCGIYDDRPRVCTTYPMTVRNGSVDLRDDVSCAGSNWNMGTLHYATWRTEIALYSMDWSTYGHVVDVWNASHRADGGSERDFLRYMLRACDAIDAEPDFASPESMHDAASWNDGPLDAARSATRARRFALVDTLAHVALAAT